MDGRRVADYFVVAGLPENPQPLEEFSNEAAIKPTYKQDPITDVTVINKSLGERVPRGYQCLDKTPNEYPADLNHGSIRGSEMYICYRRSRDKPPLTDVGVLYESKERLMAGCEVIHTTYFGTPANVNNSNNGRTYITYRRAAENAPSDMLAVVDLCIIMENKGESPPHSYCQISKNLNRGLVGSDVFLCYKKAMTKIDILAYKPAILDRYPKEDYPEFPLPESVAMFCLPMGASIECWSAKAQHPYPVFSTFILTGIGWNKVYGAAITFYEEFPEDKLTDLQMRHLGLKNKHIREQYRIMKTVHSNKSICLLSHWPFFDAFKKLLSYLYRISITGPHIVPIERHISHFMYDVPYPSPQRPRILVQLSHDSISLSMPEDSPLPQSGASFITMLRNLGPENCMTILLYVLNEHKILIHSLRPAVLTSVAEAVSTLIFPLQWQCPYIPLCPLGLSDVLNAPTPYIIGLDSRYFDLFDPPPDVICIDLDTIRIWPPDDKKNISYKLLPKKATKVLQESLHKLYDRLNQELPRQGHDEVTLDIAPIDQDFKRKHKEMILELQIQESFLRFMACILKGYKHYLKPIENAPDLDTTNAASLFDMAGFLKSREKANHKFFQTLLRTQLFNRFIEERSFVSDKDDSLAFFDECTEKVDETKDEPKLIELDDSSKSERTMFILPPEPVGLPEGKTYSYNGFPNLCSDLFLEKNKPVRSSSKNKGQTSQHSPVARRTKQEIKTAQKLAQQYITQPPLWAKCLLSHCYSLWFMVLPAYIKKSSSVTKALSLAYDVMKNMQRQKLKPPDELCYRVMLQLCGQYNQPVLAVKVYSEMKHAGVQPNAITYGYYNKAVLEGKWPSSVSKGRLLWRKVRNVIIGVAKFRKAIRRRSLSVYSNSGSEYDQISHTSFDSFLEDEKAEMKHESIMKQDSHAGKAERGTEEIESTDDDSAFKGTDTRSIDQFRSRVGSIVKKPSLGSNGHVDALAVGSSAGLLMVSESLVNGSLSKSMGPSITRSESVQDENKRKRHRSAGDHLNTKTRSNSLFSNWRHRHFSGEEKGMKFSDLMAKEESELLAEAEAGSEMKGISEEIKDSGVDLDENTEVSNLDAESEGMLFEIEENRCEEGNDENLREEKRNRVGLSEEKLESITEVSRKGSLKSVTSSPLHVSATPVTENDPLGLFVEDQNQGTNSNKEILTPKKSPEKLREKFVESRPFANEVKLRKNLEKLDLGKCNIDASTNNDDNRVDKSSGITLSKIMSPVGKVQKTLFKIERTNSFPDNLGNHGTNESEKNKSNADKTDLASLGRSSTSLYDQRTESAKPESGFFRTRSFRRHKENFSGMLKFATGAVAHKLTEIKMSMTPSKLGSNTSLTPSYEEVDSEDETYREAARKRGSLDFLHRSIDRLDTSSINGVQESAPPSHPSFMDQMDRLCEAERHSIHVQFCDTQTKDVAIEAEISSCSRCVRCRCLLYDEEIMAGWSADDSNLNTSCQFCNTKMVPHLLIYIKDHRGKKKSKLSDDEVDDSLIQFEDSPAHRHSPMEHSYGKDSNICPSPEPLLMFGEEMEDDSSVKSPGSSHDPWMRQSTHIPSEPTDIPSERPSHESPNLSELARLGHRRTGSECLTSATEFMFSSSIDSLESLTFRNLRSPLSISMESESLPEHSSVSTENRKNAFNGGFSSMEPISVPYLSPLVLRKNLESIIESEGNSALGLDTFVDEHPIIFWNLVWYFKRISATSHLPGLLLTAKSFNVSGVSDDAEFTSDNVLIQPMWDNVRLHQEVGLPMHMAWNKCQSSTTVDALLTESQPFNRAVMHQIITNIQCNDVLSPIKMVMNGRRRLRTKRKRFRSLYREILYLAFIACGRENIDNDAFDREYKMAFSRLSPGELKRLQRDDKPRSPAVQCCRRVFLELQLIKISGQ
ncbi:C-myc promoter-binding protein-like isoform X2 [Mercenaria mercenaria]|uniref:C-myc promoter-binding protein-like isoform X2 n=1 Tax=Mercenaria mercenaria TaxID=6596 RepID=UPI00234EA3D9|nr:C-myc promoter-binding protein-like isoform X2 [Mercenaria mercenaria]